MAYPYEKTDPDGVTKRWMASIAIGDDPAVRVSLRLAAPGSRKLAELRADTLQFEAKAGRLSPATSEWLGPKSTARLNRLIAQAKVGAAAGIAPESWEAAGAAWLKACEAKDTKRKRSDMAVVVERTKRGRGDSNRRHVKWLVDRREPFMGRPFTAVIADYLRDRVSRGFKVNSIHANDYAWLVVWGDWMHRRGLCEKPDRDFLKEQLPQRESSIVKLPPPDEQLAYLRWAFGVRNGARSLPGRQRIVAHRYRAAWAIILCVRGLGCRPSEAFSLMWDNVDKDLKTVTLVGTKTGIDREAPILFKWAADGLAELREASKARGAVCNSALGKPWGCDQAPTRTVLHAARACGIPHHHLKLQQKMYIGQLIAIGFPPHVVANWTGHTLSIQERHYCEGRSYLPKRGGDLEEFGVLSEWGEDVRAHLSSFANLIPQGNRQ